ncbi:35239_t:CDS:2 [Gigaspora margarita]|uniref:35239_t:CDS:1 n=1 Tax=Gigaspora margarita TaxID=4874 RepID=A0ABN7UYY1_GIGMA|nr:35239_t:CDS:2 [Gigaspora margarita]
MTPVGGTNYEIPPQTILTQQQIFTTRNDNTDSKSPPSTNDEIHYQQGQHQQRNPKVGCVLDNALGFTLGIAIVGSGFRYS